MTIENKTHGKNHPRYEQVLRILADVRPNQCATSVILIANIFLPFYARLALNWSRHDLTLRVGILFSVILVSFWLTQAGMFLDNAPVIGNLFGVFDGLAILNILIGIRVFELSINGFVLIDIFLVFVWIRLSMYLHRENARWNLSVTDLDPRQVS